MSHRIVLRTLSDLDYRNTKELMSSRFCNKDTEEFKFLWKWRNYGASLCIEYYGTILGFALVVHNKLEYLVVDQEFDGIGFGKLLVRYVKKQLSEEHRCVHLMTANDPMLRGWYAKQGFELWESSCDDNGIFGDIMICRFRKQRQAAARGIAAIQGRIAMRHSTYKS